MLFILLWLISPIVLLVLFLVQLSNNSDLKKANKLLQEQLNALLSKASDGTSASTADQAEKAVPENQVSALDNSAPTEACLPQTDNTIPADVPPTSVQPQYNPVYTQQPVPFAKQNPKKKISTINIILILGALFLSLSGFIFAAATWGILNSFFKAVVLVSFSAIFFGIHSFTERKLKLEQTGRIFYILGSIFLPAAVVAAGLLQIFGEYLSFYGDGKLLVCVMAAISICVPFFKGAKDYNNKAFAAVSHYSFSAAVVFTLFHVIPRADIAILASAIYSLLVVIAEPFIKDLYDEIFGENNVFSGQYDYFAVISTTLLGIVSTCVFLEDTFSIVTLFAFAIYSACFLTKSITEKNGKFSSVAFAFFITISLFSGFDPDSISSYACAIASTALIYATLSAMGILPEIVRKTMKILALIAASTAGFLGVVENIIYLVERSAPEWEMIFASGVVFIEMLILSIRYKSNELKAFAFAAFVWFATDFILLFELDMYGNLICFAAVSAYFLLTRLTPLHSKLYSRANDIIYAVCAAINSICCITDTSGFISMAILAVGIVCIAISRNRKISAILCPILTFQIVFPLCSAFFSFDIILPYAVDFGDSAMSVVVILFCLISSLLLFIPKASEYAKSYGISVICLLPVFLISCMIWESADYVSMIAICIYTTVLLTKYSFPKEKFSHINLLNTAILLTSIIAGFKFLDDYDYLVCFPAVAVMLIFAVYALGEAFDAFQNVNPHICTFLWWAAPFLSCCLFLAGNDISSNAVIIFGAILAVCAGFVSVTKKNTLNLILPILVIVFTIADLYTLEILLIPFAVFVIAGRILFNKKLFNSLYFDVFSLGAYIPVIAYAIMVTGDFKFWLAILVLGLLTLNLVRTGHSSVTNLKCITAAGVFIFPLFWWQPFFDVPELINVQFNLLPVFFFCLLVKLIRKDAEDKADNFSFAAAIVSLVILFIKSLTSSESFDAVFIGIVLFIMLAVSFIVKKKRWFVLAVASMVASGILLSFGQHDSIAWLVYLAIAGAALIALGLANELKKQQQKNGEETKLSRFMSDWTW